MRRVRFEEDGDGSEYSFDFASDSEDPDSTKQALSENYSEESRKAQLVDVIMRVLRIVKSVDEMVAQLEKACVSYAQTDIELEKPAKLEKLEEEIRARAEKRRQEDEARRALQLAEAVEKPSDVSLSSKVPKTQGSEKAQAAKSSATSKLRSEPEHTKRKPAVPRRDSRRTPRTRSGNPTGTNKPELERTQGQPSKTSDTQKASVVTGAVQATKGTLIASSKPDDLKGQKQNVEKPIDLEFAQVRKPADYSRLRKELHEKRKQAEIAKAQFLRLNGAYLHGKGMRNRNGLFGGELSKNDDASEISSKLQALKKILAISFPNPSEFETFEDLLCRMPQRGGGTSSGNLSKVAWARGILEHLFPQWIGMNMASELTQDIKSVATTMDLKQNHLILEEHDIQLRNLRNRLITEAKRAFKTKQCPNQAHLEEKLLESTKAQLNAMVQREMFTLCLPWIKQELCNLSDSSLPSEAREKHLITLFRLYRVAVPSMRNSSLVATNSVPRTDSKKTRGLF